jgi:hypothetical protein
MFPTINQESDLDVADVRAKTLWFLLDTYFRSLFVDAGNERDNLTENPRVARYVEVICSGYLPLGNHFEVPLGTTIEQVRRLLVANCVAMSGVVAFRMFTRAEGVHIDKDNGMRYDLKSDPHYVSEITSAY